MNRLPLDRTIPASHEASPRGGLDFLVGGGEMGARMRTTDWSGTPLGPAAEWPQSLRTSLSTCLNCSFPILIWWGPDLALLYNDACRPMLGSQRPGALGQRGPDGWPEIWDSIGPMLDRVLTAAEATSADDLLLLLERGGYPEECYFSFSYSPILSETGGVAGVFCPVIETTAKVIGERRLRTLRDLAALPRHESSAEVLAGIAGVLAANPYDLPFSLLYRFPENLGELHLAGAAGLAPGQPASPLVLPAAGDAAGWPVTFAGAEQVENLPERFPGLPTGAWEVPPPTALLLPVTLPGAARPCALLIAALNPHKQMDADYRQFLDLVVNQIATLLAEVQAYETGRFRAEARAEIDPAKTAFSANLSQEPSTPLTLLPGPMADALGSRERALRDAQLPVAHRNDPRLRNRVSGLTDFSRIEASPEPVEQTALAADPAGVFRSAPESGADSGGGIPAVAAHAGEERARVLVAEDNADLRHYLRHLLSPYWTVAAVADGRAALDAIRRQPPDLLLADVMMPGLDGFELLRRLRADPATREMPVLLLSALAGEEARVEGLAAGADDYLVKPFSGRDLLARVRNHLQLARIRRDARQALFESEARLAAETAALVRLNEASSSLWRLRELDEGLDQMLAAAIDLLGADMGNVQILDASRGVLTIAAHRGFGADFLDFFREVSADDDSACGRTLRNGERTIVEDVEADVPYAPLRPVARAAGYRAVQSTPLIGRDGQALGMLSTHFRTPHRPSDAELRRLDLYARQAADFIERCQIDATLRWQVRRDRLLSGTAARLLESEDPQSLVEALCPEVLDFLDCQAFFNFLADESHGQLHLNACAGISAAERSRIERLDFGDGVCGSVARKRRRRVADDIASTADPATDLAKSFGIQAYCCHPLLARGQLLGTLSFGTRTRSRFSPDDIAVMKAVSDLIAIAIFRIKTERALRASERRFRAIFDHQFQYSSLLTPDGRVVEISDSVVRSTGILPESVIGQPFLDAPWWRDQPATRAQWRRLFEEAQARPGPARDEAPYRTLEGSLRHGLNTVTALRDEEGQLEYLLVEGIDITERTQTEEDLRRSEMRYRLLHESLRDPFVQTSMSGHIQDCNDLFCELLGYTRSELLAMSYVDLTPERWHEMEQAIVESQIVPRGYSEVYEKEYRRKDGTLVPIELRAVISRNDAGQPESMWAIVRDISGRKQAEEALFAANQRLEAVMEALPVGVAIIGAQGERLRTNRAFERIWGEPCPEVHCVEDYAAYRAWWLDTGLPVQPEEWASAQSIREGRTVVGQILEIARFDGTRAIVHNSAAPILDESGRIAGSAVALMDVSAQFESEAALRRSEYRYRSLVEATSAITWCCPPTGRQAEPQPDWMAFTGQTAEAMLGAGWTLAIHPDDREDVAARWTTAVARGEPFFSEHRIRRHDGEWRWMNVHAVPIRDAGGAIVEWFGMNIDVTERKRIEEELRASQQTLLDAQRSARAGVWEVDLLAGRVDWSEPFYELYGLPRTVPPSTDNWIASVFPEDRPQVEAEYARALAARDVQRIEFRILRDGRVRWLHSEGRVIADASNRPIRITGITWDITERKQAEQALEESRRQLALALEAGQLGFWDWDIPSGRVDFGGHWATMLGYDPAEIEPNVQAWDRLIHPDERSAIMATLSDHLEGRTRFYECEHRLRHKDGSWRWILDRGQVVERDAEGRPLRAVGTHADVTARRRAEDALRDADRRKDEFLATLAHELRNPLAPIRNALTVLRKTIPPNPGLNRILHMIERQMAHMVRLVDDLLEVSRITRGKIELRKERVDLETAISHAVDTSLPLIEAGQHRLEISLPREPLPVEADAVRLTQVFANLLNNAAKYMESGGIIRVTAERHERQAVVSIRDTGVGMAPELLPRVFELFTQADRSADRAQGGLGIGLALVRRLLEMHGGTVTAHSEGPGQGSEFVVRLPLSEDPSASHRTAWPYGISPPVPGGRRILVVDDNLDAADSLAELLELTGHEIRVAYDGEEGLKAAQDFCPELVLLDLGMPRMDGYETCRRLRAQPWGQGITVAALTGWGQEEDRQKTRAAGFDAHLVKPVDYDALAELIAGLPAERVAPPTAT